ncbi:MAG: type I-C CRISPR-associated protein Cas8c/Csd1 [Clostridiaceae bacterium]|nr:type I-C CRISPR-associated protein Cas8c/Csd1 [Clostridiaceae bacterium]
MILRSLNDLYYRLLEQGEIAPAGWTIERVHYAVEIDSSGELLDIIPLTDERGRRQKKYRMMQIPARGTRTSTKILPHLLCDTSPYFFGIPNKKDISKDKIEYEKSRARKCFVASRELHKKLLAGIDDPSAQAVIRFYEKWDPEKAKQHPVLRDKYDEIRTKGSLIWMPNGRYITDNEAITAAVDALTSQDSSEGENVVVGQCLVTGERDHIARIHPLIKGVFGAQSSGASLVGFNIDSACSYGRSQSYNAPVGKRTAVAYSQALNHLLKDNDHKLVMGDTTVVFWAESPSNSYPDLVTMSFNPNPDVISMDNRTLKESVEMLSQGKIIDFHEEQIDPSTPFFMLGLSPNAGRLSVRFFFNSSFGSLMKNIDEHWKRLEIVRPINDERELLSMWSLLCETVNRNRKAENPKPSPQLTGDFLRAVIENHRYPDTLLLAVHRRILAEQGYVTRGRAALIKAFLLKNTENRVIKEVVNSVKLNEETRYVPYILGRLFSVLESVQESANPGVNTTIRNRYFSAACSTPAMVFPVLIRLTQSHLRKLDKKLATYYQKQITELLGHMEVSFPTHLVLQDQGIFALGYYHQRQERFAKKEEKTNDRTN